MELPNFLHHYTTINNLALILKNRTIRFNRLDQIDDVKESQSYGQYHLSRFLFVSCWTDSDNESIPLWEMYSKGMTGVRITLPTNPFLYRPIAPHPIWGGRIEGNPISLFSTEQMFTSEYIISPTWFNKRTFIKKIEYLDEVNLDGKRSSVVKFGKFADGRPMWEVAGPIELAGYKSSDWAFQNEVRYILMIWPIPKMPKSGPATPAWVDSVPDFVFNAIKNNLGPDIRFFDVEINNQALENIKVTLAPKASESEKVIVDSLLHSFTKSGSISESKLSNQIRTSLK